MEKSFTVRRRKFELYHIKLFNANMFILTIFTILTILRFSTDIILLIMRLFNDIYVLDKKKSIIFLSEKLIIRR